MNENEKTETKTKNKGGKKRILILGAGFAGMYAYETLHKIAHGRKDIEIYMISENDHFVFIPLVHEVATGNLMPSSIRQSVRTVPQCCLTEFFQGTVQAVDFDNQTVEYRRPYESSEHDTNIETFSYDYLISGLGSDTEFFGTPGAEEHSLTLKSLADARRIKNQLIAHFNRARSLSEDEQKKHLRFVIVGGGATGVELAGEFADLVHHELKDAFPEEYMNAEIIVIEGNETLVKVMGPWFSSKVEEILRKKGVKFLLNTRVTGVQENGVLVETKGNETAEFIYSDYIVWTAGVSAQALDIHASKPVEIDHRSKRIRVMDTLNIEEYPNVYIAGDQASVCDKENSQAYPMRAQFAVREGRRAAANILARIDGRKEVPFEYNDLGFIVSLGEGAAFAKLLGMHFDGFLAWFVYRAAYWTKIFSVRAKLRTALEWTLNYFNPRDISEI